MTPTESLLTVPLPDVGRLLPRQQMAIDCALCARPLGGSGRVLGEVRHRGLLFRLWVCAAGCRPTASAVAATWDGKGRTYEGRLVTSSPLPVPDATGPRRARPSGRP
ncbi:hypothetical protein JK359_06490 [Streptomyces actinomycinicus]|uniref:Uncharacterized protein n=1 Tax=Streptomyces actinomycinicus TaxID=1695166 RepID=A0A937EGH3_9ACTN|nr:hypothetical protein [Streptomyces actinomycinicus]MBL1081629.1 hypothetical protein [Streptomyces actinomycinicus]